MRVKEAIVHARVASLGGRLEHLEALEQPDEAVEGADLVRVALPRAEELLLLQIVLQKVREGEGQKREGGRSEKGGCKGQRGCEAREGRGGRRGGRS